MEKLERGDARGGIHIDAKEDKCGIGESKGLDSNPLREARPEGLNEGRVNEAPIYRPTLAKSIKHLSACPFFLSA